MIAESLCTYMLAMMQVKYVSFWLKNNATVLADNAGFKKAELAKIDRIVVDHYSLIEKTVYEYCEKYKD